MDISKVTGVMISGWLVALDTQIIFVLWFVYPEHLSSAGTCYYAIRDVKLCALINVRSGLVITLLWLYGTSLSVVVFGTSWQARSVDMSTGLLVSLKMCGIVATPVLVVLSKPLWYGQMSVYIVVALTAAMSGPIVGLHLGPTLVDLSIHPRKIIRLINSIRKIGK